MTKSHQYRLTTLFTFFTFFTGVLLILRTLPVRSSAAAQKFRVTDVSLKADNANGGGQCPVTLNFTGHISADNAGTVQYVFIRSDGATGPVQTLDFKAAGTQTVSTSWTLGDAKSLPSYQGWQAMRIISPNALESSHETGSFAMKCGESANPIDKDGNPRTSESTGAPRPLASSFRVTLNGYRVDHQTRDDALERDGVGDEVSLVLDLATVDSSGRFEPRRWGNIFSSLMGQQPRNEIRAGTGSDRGGLITGDGFPTATPWRRLTPVNPGIPPNTLFEGELTQGANAALIIPTIWEWDNTGALRTTFADALERDRPAITSTVRRLISSSLPAAPESYVLPGSSLGIGNTITLGHGPLGLGQVNDRPIGMRTLDGNFGFTPQALVLTYDGARVLARADFGFGRGVIPVRYQDDRSLEGDYTLFIHVEDTSSLPSGPCAPALSATFNGTATMTTTNDNARGPFTSDLRLSLSFEDCRATLRITEFPSISVTFPTPIGDNTTTVTMPSGGTGTFASGRIDIPVSLRFANTIAAGGTSFADMTLTTALPGGSALRDGSVTLVGSGRFRGGFLNGSTCSLTVSGTITPAP
ncbi:MAG TPA: hypothetical protein VN844_12505 [Pyrinomonadaceae bacterium]|nr:hypothetical protein [Pyrinomonadaceae bacterium]